MRAKASLSAFAVLIALAASPAPAAAAPTQLLATLNVTADSIPQSTGAVTLSPGATYRLVISGSISITFPYRDGSRTVVQDALYCYDHGGTPIPADDPNPESCQRDSPGPALSRPLLVSYAGIQDGPLINEGYSDQHHYDVTFVYRPSGPAASLSAQWRPGTVTAHGGSIKVELYGEPTAGGPPPPTTGTSGCSVSPGLRTGSIAHAAQASACKSPADVKRWTKMSLEWNEMAADLCIVGSVAAGSAFVPGNQVPGGITAAAFGLGCALAWKASARYAKWANDPPDPNYKEVSTPARFRVPKLTAAGRSGRRTASALNALLQNFSDQASMAGALTHAFERTQGAAQAGDRTWEAKQRSAASLYATGLANLIRGRAGLAAHLRTALRATGERTISVNRSAARRAQRRIGTDGLSRSLSRTLARGGLTPSQRADLRADLLLRKPSAKGTSVLTILTDPALAASERAAAEAFEGLATTVDGS